MKRGNRLRNRLILVYLSATLLPLILTIWTSIELLDATLNRAPIHELDRTSRALERLGREYYQEACESLARDAVTGRATPQTWRLAARSSWPESVAEFWDSGDESRFERAGETGRLLEYMQRQKDGVRRYTRELRISLKQAADQFTAARTVLDESPAPADLRRGLFMTMVAVSSAIWVGGLVFLIYWADRLSRPVQTLTRGLAAVAEGDLTARLPVHREDEIGAAMKAFNDMASQLQTSRERLIHVTRLESWQALARKTAHEVKNSLTPIRLTMEEIIARGGDDEFLKQVAQIAVDEVVSLERRVRAFSELASEPPVTPITLDVNGIVEERIAFLRTAHPDVVYNARLDPVRPGARADPDLVKGVLTNLMENAAEAARAGGVVLVKTQAEDQRVAIEVHDSGPGLSALARGTVFEPTISFKKNGMGLGLSIARKSALLCGGDVALIRGELGGAAFRVVLPGAH